MPYEISWYAPPHVLFVSITGDMDIPSIRALSENLLAELKQGTPPVHILTDVTHMGRYPGNVTEFRNAMQMLTGRFDSNILIGRSSPMLKFIASVISQVSRYELRMVSSLDEALDALSKIDPNLSLPNQG